MQIFIGQWKTVSLGYANHEMSPDQFLFFKLIGEWNIKPIAIVCADIEITYSLSRFEYESGICTAIECVRDSSNRLIGMENTIRTLSR